MAENPKALDAYERLAETYAARVDTKAHNAFYDLPAVISLLPPVGGKRVLDAGCGPGVYSEWLVDHGAEVVGIDFSPTMVKLANRRLQGRARILEADLGQPLRLLETASFDTIVSALALDYVKDWAAVFSEFFRVLREPGLLIFSAGHPADVPPVQRRAAGGRALPGQGRGAVRARGRRRRDGAQRPGGGARP